MHDYLADMLECPLCHGSLEWTVQTRREGAIEEGETVCRQCGATYPIREGIGIFLTPDLPRNDLWEQTESGLARYLRSRPDLETQLLEAESDVLHPADLLFRSMILEERGRLRQAREQSRKAMQALYTPDYQACFRSQIDYVVNRLAGYEGPIVDLASGRGTLVEILTERLDNPIVMTDFSPVVLRRDRRMLDQLGLSGRVSLLAFDARRTPMKARSVRRMTSNLGLVSVEESGNLLAELRRIVSGELLAITHFYPEDDDAHRQAGQSNDLLYRKGTVRRFEDSGWTIRIANECRGRAEPTPVGQILEGFAIDGLPLAPTLLDWCVVVAA